VQLQRDIVPLFASQCVSCHATGTEAGYLGLTAQAAFRNLVSVPSKESSFLRVEPGKPDTSYLVMKLEGTHLDHGGRGARMPLGGTRIDVSTLQKIRAWIEAGAPDN
jgi:hypothetical protein